RISAAGRRPDLRFARGRRHHPGKPRSRARTLRHRRRGAAGRSARHRRQCARLGEPQPLSTGRQRVFVAHCRAPILHRDREPAAIERATMSWPYDYIIIGAGSAGSTIANRLAENYALNILILEAGPPDTSFMLKMPAGFASLGDKSPYNWHYETVPQKHCNDRRMYWPRGKTLGGSSSINAMLYVRGTAWDYDHWRQLGNEGWSYNDVLPFFKKAENNERGGDDFHG